LVNHRRYTTNLKRVQLVHYEATTADTREALSADDMLVYSDYRWHSRSIERWCKMLNDVFFALKRLSLTCTKISG
jgi:hypothetical protein